MPPPFGACRAGRTPRPASRAPSALTWLASTVYRMGEPWEPCLPLEREAAGSAGGDPAIEFFQDCGVGVFKQPLLGGRRGVAGVHEDPVVTFTAVHATAADGVV